MMSANFCRWILPEDTLSDATSATWTATYSAAGYAPESLKTSLPGDAFRFGGLFRILAGGVADNDVLDWGDSTAAIRSVTLTGGDYTGTTLAAHIQTLMNASASSDVYAVAYSLTTGKFTIQETDGPSTFTLRWSSGSASCARLATSLGYDNTSNDTGTSSTSDTVVVHTEDYLRIDMGSAVTPGAGFFMGHFLSADASVKIYGHGTDAITGVGTGVSYRTKLTTTATLLKTLTAGTDYLYDDEDDFASWTHSGAYRYLYISIIDVIPRDGAIYHEFGRAGWGNLTTPTRDYIHGWSLPLDDLAQRSGTVGGVLFQPRLRTPQAWTGDFRAIETADRDLLRALWRAGRQPLPFWWEYQDGPSGGMYGQVVNPTFKTKSAMLTKWNVGPVTVAQVPKRVV